MKAENKSRWMIWVIIILAVMNLTTILTLVFNKTQISNNEVSAETDPALAESASMKYSGRYFRDELGLNNEQMNKFSEFNPAFRQEVKTINLKLSEKRNEMLIEMSANNCDTIKLNMLSDSIGNLHANLKKETYMYYLNFKNICNTLQQEKLKQLFNEMFTTEVQTDPNRTGNPGSRGFGRWFNN